MWKPIEPIRSSSKNQSYITKLANLAPTSYSLLPVGLPVAGRQARRLKKVAHLLRRFECCSLDQTRLDSDTLSALSGWPATRRHLIFDSKSGATLSIGSRVIDCWPILD